MGRKIIYSILFFIITMLIIILLIYGYFKIVGLESRVPEKKENLYSIRTEKYLDRKVFIVTPNEGKTNEEVILYLHGGAYVGEIEMEHWEFIGQLITDTGVTVILPDYPLAPKYRYTDTFKMVEPLYKEIVDKVGAEKLTVMGDSAGGGMSLALVEKISTETNYKIPSKTILISPWLDVRLTNSEIEEVEKYDKQLNKETLKLAGLAYAGEDGINNYLVNPIDGDISKLKNVTIFTGTYDILNPDVHKLLEKSKKIGIEINVKEYEKAGHIWMINKNGDKELVDKAYNDLLNVLKYK